MEDPSSTDEPAPDPPGLIARTLWTGLGLGAVGLGGLGIVVPGLPSTVFFIMAAWAFSKSNPRLEAWVLGLPRVGPLVSDYRAGLGMPRSAKITATVMIVFFVGLSAFLVEAVVLAYVIVFAGAIGVTVVWIRVPTKAPPAAP